MAEPIPRLVDFDEALKLSSWSGIQIDLEFVRDACGRLLDIDEDDPVLRRALLVAAVVAYARCFKSHEGVRIGFDESELEGIAKGKEGLPDLHDFYIDLRDKHFAHSVNAFELASVGVTDLGSGTLGIVSRGTYMIGMKDKQSIEDLREIAELLIDNVVNEKKPPLESVVLYRYRSLTEEQVNGLPQQLAPEPAPRSDVGRAREGPKRQQRRQKRH